MFNLFRKKKEDIYEILLPGEKSQKEKPFNTPKQEKDRIFEDVVGYDDIKRVFRMALKSDEPIHVLLVGPPASAKTIFLDALIRKLGDKQAYFAIGSSSTKAGVVNMLFMREPKYLMVDEIDKLPMRDQASLLGLMETGELVETKVSKTRCIKLKTWVFATANTTATISKRDSWYLISNPIHTKILKR